MALQLSQATKALDSACAAMAALEANSSLTLPWTPDSPQHMEAMTLCQHQDYHHLLDEIEQCAVSHQFEIEKMGLPKTGEILVSDYPYVPTSTLSWPRLQNLSKYHITGCKVGEDSPYHPQKVQYIGSEHESTQAKADLGEHHQFGFHLRYCDTVWPWRYSWQALGTTSLL